MVEAQAGAVGFPVRGWGGSKVQLTARSGTRAAAKKNPKGTRVRKWANPVSAGDCYTLATGANVGAPATGAIQGAHLGWDDPTEGNPLFARMRTRRPSDATVESEENADRRLLAEAVIGALNSGDLEAFLAFTAEDIEFTSMVAEAEGTTFRGHDGVRVWWETVRGAFEDVRWELFDVRGSGDRAVGHFRMVGTLGSVPVEQAMWQAIVLRDSKAIWWAFFRTEREALEAVGLRE